MNGTSMASPCAAGGLALLVSALKAEGASTAPARVRRAAENTARPLGGGPAGALTHGRGLLQVLDAYDYLARAGAAGVDAPAELRLDVAVRRAGGGGGGGGGAPAARGVYLREPADAAAPAAFTVEVSPRLREGADVRAERLAVDLHLVLRVTAPWVTAPSILALTGGGRTFEVDVDPRGVPEGEVAYAEVQGFDADAEWRGPLFRLPVTVARPEAAPARAGVAAPLVGWSLSLDPGAATGGEAPGGEARRLVAAPEGATWAELRLRRRGGALPATLMVRATQQLPHTRYSHSEHRSTAVLVPGAEAVSRFAVAGGATREVTVGAMWNSVGAAEIEAEVTFHGVEVSAAAGGAAGALCLDGAAGALKVFARAPLGAERAKPTAKLDALRIPLRPAAGAEPAPLSGTRDALPGARTPHRLVLEYKLKLEEGGKVRPLFPLTQGYVYDGELEQQMVSSLIPSINNNNINRRIAYQLTSHHTPPPAGLCPRRARRPGPRRRRCVRGGGGAQEGRVQDPARAAPRRPDGVEPLQGRAAGHRARAGAVRPRAGVPLGRRRGARRARGEEGAGAAAGRAPRAVSGCAGRGQAPKGRNPGAPAGRGARARPHR
jgi:tripeptidyl-peptidase-2